MKASEKLVDALTKASAPAHIISNAKEGYYGDFTSPLATPITQLVNDLYAYNMHALAKQAINGEFDGE